MEHQMHPIWKHLDVRVQCIPVVIINKLPEWSAGDGGPQSMGSKGILHTLPPSAGWGCFPVSNLHNRDEEKFCKLFLVWDYFFGWVVGVKCISGGLSVICWGVAISALTTSALRCLDTEMIVRFKIKVGDKCKMFSREPRRGSDCLWTGAAGSMLLCCVDLCVEAALCWRL